MFWLQFFPFNTNSDTQTCVADNTELQIRYQHVKIKTALKFNHNFVG